VRFWWLTLVTLAPLEADIWRVMVQSQPRQRVQETTHLQNNQKKMDSRCVAQKVEHLLCEHLLCKQEATSSNPGPTPKKKILIVVVVLM
jgi:hypothetical protein